MPSSRLRRRATVVSASVCSCTSSCKTRVSKHSLVRNTCCNGGTYGIGRPGAGGTDAERAACRGGVSARGGIPGRSAWVVPGQRQEPPPMRRGGTSAPLPATWPYLFDICPSGSHRGKEIQPVLGGFGGCLAGVGEVGACVAGFLPRWAPKGRVSGGMPRSLLQSRCAATWL